LIGAIAAATPNDSGVILTDVALSPAEIEGDELAGALFVAGSALVRGGSPGNGTPTSIETLDGYEIVASLPAPDGLRSTFAIARVGTLYFTIGSGGEASVCLDRGTLIGAPARDLADVLRGLAAGTGLAD
jgi:hypothetical protein